MARFAVILPAAGQSRRFGQKQKKVFVELQGRPVWVRAVEHFVNRDDVAQTLLVVAPDDVEWFREKFQAHLAFMDLEIVAGGAERADSVQNALARVRADIDFVAIHDAARPLLTKSWINAVFQAAEKYEAAILATPISSTVKRVPRGSDQILETVPREELWAAQTPQVFRRQLLLDAYAQRNGFVATDEAQLVERLGTAVRVVTGSAMNLKITTAEDMRIAQQMLEILPKEGFRPLHPFADERPDFLK